VAEIPTEDRHPKPRLKGSHVWIARRYGRVPAQSESTTSQPPGTLGEFRRRGILAPSACFVPESSDGPKGKLNYPDGFVSSKKSNVHFAFDDNRHRSVYFGAKLPTGPTDE